VTRQPAHRGYFLGALVVLAVVVLGIGLVAMPGADSSGSDDGGGPASEAAPVTNPPTAPSSVATVTTSTTLTPATSTTSTTTLPPESVVVSRLSIREKAAQLLMIPVAGLVADNVGEVLADSGIGGVFITSGQGNISDLAQVVKLTSDLQRRSIDRVGVGMLIATDQEGGQVFKASVDATTNVPSARVLGRIDDPSVTGVISEVMGRELAALGINVDLAPVADVSTTPNFLSRTGRTYGTEADLVARHVAAAVEGLQAGGVAATLKHYPGHGSTRTDSHFGLPVIDTDMSTLSERDLVPFAAGIAAGVKLVMLGHLVVPAIDPDETPAPFSSAVIALLRSSFSGVIMTDDIGAMAAVSAVPEQERVVRAITAGADLVLGPRDPVGAIEAIVAAVGDGTIPVSRFDDAVMRVTRLKIDLGLLDPVSLDAEAAALVIGGPESAEARSLLVGACRDVLGRAC